MSHGSGKELKTSWSVEALFGAVLRPDTEQLGWFLCQWSSIRNCSDLQLGSNSTVACVCLCSSVYSVWFFFLGFPSLSWEHVPVNDECSHFTASASPSSASMCCSQELHRSIASENQTLCLCLQCVPSNGAVVCHHLILQPETRDTPQQRGEMSGGTRLFPLPSKSEHRNVRQGRFILCELPSCRFLVSSEKPDFSTDVIQSSASSVFWWCSDAAKWSLFRSFSHTVCENTHFPSSPLSSASNQARLSGYSSWPV